MSKTALIAPPVIEAVSRRYYAVLLRYFMRRGASPPDAQDLAQDVFAKLADGARLGAVDNVEAFLFTIAANAHIDWIRRQKVRADTKVQDHFKSLDPTDFAPDRMLEAKEELGSIIAALNEMPERMRNIFILARLENFPRAEIARRLGISKSLVEQQLAAAIACLVERRSKLT